MPDESIDVPVRFVVGWGDLDANQPRGHTSILDRAADARLTRFAGRGDPGGRFAEDRIGPVIGREELVHQREPRHLEEIPVDLRAHAVSRHGVRLVLETTVRNEGGEATAVVAPEDRWFDLEGRGPQCPPPELDAGQRPMRRSPGDPEGPTRPERSGGPS